MNRNDYWRKREEEQLKHYLTEEADIQRAMAEKYNYMLYQIQAQINDFYARYARREQITLAEAMQRVSKMDVQAFGAKAKKYVEKRDFSPKANRELRLYNATMRINRLELLKANIGLEMVDGFNDLEHLMDNSLTKRTRDELKRQKDILRRDAGILGESISNNAKTVGSIVNASFNNATWSERIWGNQTQLRNELSSLLTQGLIQGRNPRVLAPALEKMFGVSRRNAERLMATELARVQTDAQMQTFKENDIDEYIFLSMDTACHECMALNEEHFPVRDAMPGENAPPIHPNCRCSTAAYIDREALERELFGEEAKLRSRNDEETPVYERNIDIDKLENSEQIKSLFSEIHFYKNFDKLSLEIQKEIAQGFDYMRNRYGNKVLPKTCGAKKLLGENDSGETIPRLRKTSFAIDITKENAFATACHECVHVYDVNRLLLSDRILPKARDNAGLSDDRAYDFAILDILGRELYNKYHNDPMEIMAYSFEEILFGSDNALAKEIVRLMGE